MNNGEDYYIVNCGNDRIIIGACPIYDRYSTRSFVPMCNVAFYRPSEVNTIEGFNKPILIEEVYYELKARAKKYDDICPEWNNNKLSYVLDVYIRMDLLRIAVSEVKEYVEIDFDLLGKSKK